jgi:uncharacterized protein YjbI with pentapeptide repeats
VQAVGVLLAGLVGLGGLFFTWQYLKQTRLNIERQLQQARESQERAQASAQETLRLTEQGQITERFTRAIDQLGATDDKGEKKLEIRLGGIYTLERIDKESPERAYHPMVIEVLTAYVRENSRWDHEKPSTPTSSSNEDAEQDEGVEQDEEPPVRRPPTDIQAILDVLNHREEDHVPEQHRVGLDLREANLQGANLQAADLQGADLQGANLYGAILYGAHLQGAILQRAILYGADLQAANLYGAILQGANLQAAILEGANLQRAILYGANLQRANLQRAILQEADLQATNLRGANLHEANLQGANLQAAKLQRAILYGAILQRADLLAANLQGANLQAAILRGAILRGAILRGANLQEADLYGAHLRGAYLQEADLHGANLQQANLQRAILQGTYRITQDQIESTIGSNETKLPEGLNRPELWSKSLEEQIKILQERINRAE